MLDKAIKGSQTYWGWIILLLALMGVGFLCYLLQWYEGLIITGMSRDVSWGFYIGQLTYFVGVAAGGVMVVLPYYLHDYKAFGRITILGEFLAVGSIIICLLSPQSHFDPLLGRDRPERVSVPEYHYRLERAGCRA